MNQTLGGMQNERPLMYYEFDERALIAPDCRQVISNVERFVHSKLVKLLPPHVADMSYAGMCDTSLSKLLGSAGLIKHRS